MDYLFTFMIKVSLDTPQYIFLGVYCIQIFH